VDGHGCLARVGGPDSGRGEGWGPSMTRVTRKC
jgi:hypothetical protein